MLFSNGDGMPFDERNLRNNFFVSDWSDLDGMDGWIWGMSFPGEDFFPFPLPLPVGAEEEVFVTVFEEEEEEGWLPVFRDFGGDD